MHLHYKECALFIYISLKTTESTLALDLIREGIYLNKSHHYWEQFSMPKWKLLEKCVGKAAWTINDL